MMTAPLACSVCSSRGYLGERQCPNCRGFGFVLSFGERILGWKRAVDRFSAAARRTARFVNAAINVLLAAVAALAALEFGFGVFMGTPISWEYWGEAKNPPLLFFWFGVCCFFLFLSRRRAARYQLDSVLYRAYGEAEPAVAVPPTWEGVRGTPSKGYVNAARACSRAAMAAVEKAAGSASEAGMATIEAPHLFLALLEDRDVKIMFARAGAAVSGLVERAARAAGSLSVPQGAPYFAPSVQRALLGAYVLAYRFREERVESADLVLALSEDAMISEILNDVGITPETLANIAAWLRITKDERSRIVRYRRAAALKPAGALDRAMTAIATPMLDRFSYDLTRAARAGRLPFLVGREDVMQDIFRSMEGGRASVVLVGEPGVGKDTIIDGLAERMVSEDVPKPLQDKRLVLLSVSDLVSGAAPEEIGDRLLRALDEVARSKNIVLALSGIDALVGVSVGGVDLSDMFATELSRGYFFCLATAMPSRYKKLEGRPLANALERIDVPEPAPDECIRILMSIVGQIEGEQRVFFTYPAIERAVTLSSRYLHDRYLPEKAVEILRESAQACRQKKGEKSLVDAEDVAEVVSEKSHVPVTAVTESERDKLLNLESKLHERVIGQDEAVKAVAAALRRARAEIRSKKRPIAAFLFLGPTGVGKTELAKTVAGAYFGDEKRMIRLDMSEYQEASSVRRLIGVPGETGGGLLTEAVRRDPFSLILLDELEKAHPDLLNIFLQVLDDGRLTDNEGRTVDFTNSIIVATSNAGSQFIQDAIREGRSDEEVKKGLLNRELKGVFRPEFLNRFDGVIVFKPLTKEEIEQVAWLMMGGITDELSGRGITFRATDDAVAELAAVGFDPVFGARPMRRLIQEKVENALAESLLKEEIGRRDTAILEPAGVIRIEKGKKL